MLSWIAVAIALASVAVAAGARAMAVQAIELSLEPCSCLEDAAAVDDAIEELADDVKSVGLKISAVAQSLRDELAAIERDLERDLKGPPTRSMRDGDTPRAPRPGRGSW